MMDNNDEREDIRVRELAISILLAFKTSLSTASEYCFDSWDDADAVFCHILDILDAADCHTIGAFCDIGGKLYVYMVDKRDRTLSL